jgi:transcriptional regulator with XRE-family HTH domain
MEDVIVAFGKRIRRLRQRTGRSQERFVARTGLDRLYCGRSSGASATRR